MSFHFSSLALATAAMSSLVIQTSFLGDMVLTTPLLAQLARSGPVDVVATRGAAALLANNPDVRDVVVYDKRGADRGARGFVRLARRLRAVGYDAAYLAQGSMRSAALALAAGIPRRVGFDTSAGRRLYTATVTYREDWHHAARLFALGAGSAQEEPSPDELRPRLYPGDAERRAVDALLGDAVDGAPLVALAPGSVWATKRWPHYAPLASLLAARGARLVVVGGPEDAPLAAEIADAVGSSTIDATGRLSLLASAELIGRAAAIVTNDSAPQHLASAMATPTVTIFGPTVPDFGFGPLAPQRATVGHESLDCRPCDRHGPERCPLGHWRCMRDVAPAVVVAALDGILPAGALSNGEWTVDGTR
jgi:heptosyltransferase-2